MSSERGITTPNAIIAILIAIILITAAFGAYGWLRPIEEVVEPIEMDLVDRAKLEGTLTIYSAIDTPDFEQVVKPAFLDIYPWATINFVGLGSGEALSKIISEYQAGLVTADVYTGTQGAVYTAYEAGAIATYANPMVSLMHYPEGSFDPSNRWQPCYTLPIVLIYNINLVPEDEVPQSWEELADAKWNGKFAIDSPAILNAAGPLFAHMYPILGETAWNDLMQDIAANNPIITQSSSDIFQKVVSGEVHIGLGLVNDYVASQDEDLPINIAWLEPNTAIALVATIQTDAPHPAMAQLFLQWWSSADGQYANGATGRVPAHPALAADTVLAGLLPPGVQVAAAASNNPDFYENPDDWSDTFKDIFG